MSPLFFLLKCSIKNGFKQIFKKPGALIGYGIWLTLIVFGSVSMLFNKSLDSTVPAPNLYIAIANVLTMMIILPNIIQGMSLAGFNFRMADVNLIFTSPLSPGKILLYSQIRQAGTSAIVVVIMLMQAPMLNRFFGIDGQGIIIYLIAWGVIMLTASPFSMFMYATLGHRKIMQKFVKYTIYALLLAYLGWVFYSVIHAEKPLEGIITALSAPDYRFVPILGWYRQLFASAITGFDLNFLWFLLAILITATIAGWYAMKTLGIDYYEDAIATAEKMEKVLEVTRKGETGYAILYDKKKVRKVQHSFTLHGAGAIFQKQLLEYRKKGFYFINSRTLIITLSALLVTYFVPSTEIADDKLLIALAIVVYISLFFSFQGNWSRELQKPYIYLIPDSAFRKLILSNLAEALKHLTDGLILFVIAAVIYNLSFVSALLCTLAYAIYNMMYCFMDIISQRIFGTIHSKLLGIYAKFFFSIIAILPGIIAASVLLYYKISTLFVLGALNIINLLIGALIGLLAAKNFNNPEMNL